MRCIFCLEEIKESVCQNRYCVCYAIDIVLHTSYGFGAPSGHVGAAANYFYHHELKLVPKNYLGTIVKITIHDPEYKNGPLYMFGWPTGSDLFNNFTVSLVEDFTKERLLP